MITYDQTAAFAEAERLRNVGVDVAVWVMPDGMCVVCDLSTVQR